MWLVYWYLDTYQIRMTICWKSSLWHDTGPCVDAVATPHLRFQQVTCNKPEARQRKYLKKSERYSKTVAAPRFYTLLQNKVFTSSFRSCTFLMLRNLTYQSQTLAWYLLLAIRRSDGVKPPQNLSLRRCASHHIAVVSPKLSPNHNCRGESYYIAEAFGSLCLLLGT
jgi:hypothetical protein